jgi:hypothetical protein
MQERINFLGCAAKAFAATQAVLSFHGLASTRPADLNFQPYLEAMRQLCRRKNIGFAALDDLRRIIGLFRFQSTGFKNQEQMQAGAESAVRYHRWLKETFPLPGPGVADCGPFGLN